MKESMFKKSITKNNTVAFRNITPTPMIYRDKSPTRQLIRHIDRKSYSKRPLKPIIFDQTVKLKRELISNPPIPGLSNKNYKIKPVLIRDFKQRLQHLGLLQG